MRDPARAWHALCLDCAARARRLHLYGYARAHLSAAKAHRAHFRKVCP